MGVMPRWIADLVSPVAGQLESVTPIGWTAISACLAAVILRGYIKLRRRVRPANPSDRTDRALLIAALFFVAVIFASFAIGTFEGAAAFASDQLGWRHWMQVIPWGALDASTLGFGLFAVRALIRKRSPRRPLRIAYLSAAMSATIQMMQGGKEHHWQAGVFLAFLAVMMGTALDVVIDQLRGTHVEIADERVRIRPPFGLRWLTSPTTLPAWLAWTNYPPEGLEPTVANGLRHLETVRAAKRARMAGRPMWWAIQPWLYASRLAARVEAERAEHIAESARLADDAARRAEQVAEHIRDLTARVERAEIRAETAEQDARADAEQEITDLREQIREGRRVATARPAQRGTERPPSSRAPQVAATSALDEQIVEKLLGPFTEQAEQNGSLPTRYWVQQNGSCWPRQAARVLDLLASRYAESKREHNSPDGSARESSDDQEPQRVPVGATA